jgi:hypothetical protein
MILGFKQQFPDGRLTHFRRKIEQGIKIHSIREDVHNRWCTGRLIQMSTGVRTKYYNCFAKMYCTGTQQITIQWSYDELARRITFAVYVDNRLLSPGETRQLTINDGFSSIEGFLSFFPHFFRGKIIHWTTYRY